MEKMERATGVEPASEAWEASAWCQVVEANECFLEGFSWGEAAECGAPLKPVQLGSGSPKSAKTAHAFDATMIRTVKQPG